MVSRVSGLILVLFSISMNGYSHNKLIEKICADSWLNVAAHLDPSEQIFSLDTNRNMHGFMSGEVRDLLLSETPIKIMLKDGQRFFLNEFLFCDLPQEQVQEICNISLLCEENLQKYFALILKIVDPELMLETNCVFTDYEKTFLGSDQGLLKRKLSSRKTLAWVLVHIAYIERVLDEAYKFVIVYLKNYENLSLYKAYEIFYDHFLIGEFHRFKQELLRNLKFRSGCRGEMFYQVIKKHTDLYPLEIISDFENPNFKSKLEKLCDGQPGEEEMSQFSKMLTYIVSMDYFRLLGVSRTQQFQAVLDKVDRSIR